MTLVIENANEEFLPLFQEAAKLSKAKIKITSDNITQAIKDFEKERKSGKTKRYKDVVAFRKAMNG